MAASIRFNGAAGPVYVTAGTVVTLSNFDNTGVLGWEWTLLDRPTGSAATLGTPTASTSTFTADVEGSYFVRLRTYSDAPRTLIDDADRQILAVRFAAPYDWRKPAAGERTEVDPTRGWATAIDEVLDDLRAYVATPVTLQGAYDGGSTIDLDSGTIEITDGGLPVLTLGVGTSTLATHWVPDADGTYDLGYDAEVDPLWWRNAFIDGIQAGNTETSTLTVSASANITEAFLSSGSLANPSLNFWGTGFYSPSSGTLMFTTGGADVLALAGGGGVLAGNWVPSVDLTYSLGSGGQRWAEIHAGDIYADSITLSTPVTVDHGATTGLGDDDHTQYLLVDGTRAMTGKLRGIAGTAASPAFSVGVGLNTGMYEHAPGYLAFGTSGTIRLLVSTAGVAAQGIVYVSGTSSLATPAFTFNGGAGYGMHFTGSATSLAAAGIEVLRAQAPAGIEPQVLVPNGLVGKPSIGFISHPTDGIYHHTSTAGQFFLVSQGAPALGISNGGVIQFYYAGSGTWNATSTAFNALASGSIHAQGVNSTLQIGARQELTTSTLASVQMKQYANLPFIGANVSQTMFSIEPILNQTGTAAFSALKIDITNTALGSGAQYFADFRVGGTTVAAITNGSTAATQGRVLAGVGALTTPTYSFIDSPTSGLYRYAADAIGIALAGSAKFAFSGNYLYANQSLGGLSSTASNNAIGIRTVIGNSTTGIGLLIDNSTTFTAVSGGQSHVELRSTVNQAASTAGYSSLKVNVTNTALGSGAQYLADFQVANTTVAAITNGTTAATQGRVLAGYGATATPGIGWLGDDTVGLVRTGVGSMGVISQSAERWRFEGGTFYAMANGAAIRQNVANGSLIIYGNTTSATDDRAGIQMINVNNMSAASGSARHVMIENNINQSGTAGYTVLDVIADETGTGSGAKYLLNMKAGAGGTSQKFAVKNDGSVLITEGTLTNAALGFLANPDTGIVSAAALGAPGVPAMLFMVDGVFAGGFIDEASSGDVQFRTVSGSQAVPSLAIDQNDLGFYAPSGNQGAAVADNVEVFRWEAPSTVATFTVASAVKHTPIGIFPTIADLALGDSAASPFAAAQPWGFIYSKLFSSTEDGSATFPTFGWETYTGSGGGAGVYYNGAVAISDAGVQVANFNGVLTSSLGTVLDAMKFTPSISTSGASSGYNAFVIDVAEPLATGTGEKSLLDLRYATAARLKVLTSGQILAVGGTDTAPTYSFAGQASTGIYFDGGTGYTQFTHNGTASLQFTEDGIVGLNNASVRMPEGSETDLAFGSDSGNNGMFFGGGGDRVHFAVNGFDVIQLNGTSGAFMPSNDNDVSLGASGFRWQDVHAVTTTIGDLVMKDPHGGRAHLKLVEGEATMHVYDIRNGKKYHVPLVEDEMTDADRAFIEAERARWPEYETA